MRLFLVAILQSALAAVDIDSPAGGVAMAPTLAEQLLSSVNYLSAKFDRLALDQRCHEGTSCPCTNANAVVSAADADDAMRWSLRRGISAEMLASDLNVHGNEERTLLMSAAYSGNLAIADALIQAGADVNVKDDYGQTALIMAAKEGHAAIAAVLLAVPGIDVNAQDKYGKTAIMYAAKSGFGSIVKLLLAVPGISVTSVDDGFFKWFTKCENKSGCDALFYAELEGHNEVAAAIRAAIRRTAV